MLHAVRAIKSAGIALGVIVLLGVGGYTYARSHVKDTIQVINGMDLDRDDLVYFSELLVAEGMDYARQAYQESLKPLSPEERLAQGEAIEHG